MQGLTLFLFSTFSGTANFNFEMSPNSERRMTAEEFIQDIALHKLDLNHETLLEQFWFKEDGRVVANIGEKNGPICGPVLPYRIENDDCLIIGEGDIQFSWTGFRIERDKLSVLCGGETKNYSITRIEKKQCYLP